MEEKSCFFIGHRETPTDILPALKQSIEQHICEYGVSSFFVGQYGAFDLLATKCVIEAKKNHPGIKLSILLPYHPAEKFVEVPEGADGTFYPMGMEKVPRRFAIVRANQKMVDQVDYLIAYAWHPASNARKLVEYAKRREQHSLIQVTVLKMP